MDGFREANFDFLAEADGDPCRACNTYLDKTIIWDYRSALREKFLDKFKYFNRRFVEPVLKDRFDIQLIFKAEESTSPTIRPFFYATWAEKQDQIRRAQLNIMISNDIKPEDNGIRTKKFSVKFCLYNKCKPDLPKNEDFDNFIANISANMKLFEFYLLKSSNEGFAVFNHEGKSYGLDYKYLSEFSESDVLKYFVEGHNQGLTFQEIRKNYTFPEDAPILSDFSCLSLSIVRDIILLYPIFLFAAIRGQKTLLEMLKKFDNIVSLEKKRALNIWNRNGIKPVDDKIIKFHKGETRYDFNNLFGDYIKDCKELVIEDHYLRNEYQIANLRKFLSLIENMKEVIVSISTTYDDRNPKETAKQKELLRQLEADYKNKVRKFILTLSSYQDGRKGRTIETELWRIKLDHGIGDMFFFDKRKGKCFTSKQNEIRFAPKKGYLLVK
jgi:hypothetical protein